MKTRIKKFLETRRNFFLKTRRFQFFLKTHIHAKCFETRMQTCIYQTRRFQKNLKLADFQTHKLAEIRKNLENKLTNFLAEPSPKSNKYDQN